MSERIPEVQTTFLTPDGEVKPEMRQDTKGEEQSVVPGKPLPGYKGSLGHKEVEELAEAAGPDEKPGGWN